MSIRLRPFEPDSDDAGRLAALPGSEALAWSSEGTWIAEREDPLGWVHAHRRRLLGWYVQPSERGRGLGRRLLERALDVHGELRVAGDGRWRASGLASLGFTAEDERYRLCLPRPSGEDLERGLRAVRECSPDRGRVELIVRRTDHREREVLESAELCPDRGLVGDHWSTRPSRHTPDGGPHPGMQLTLMNARAAAAVAGPRERWPLAGDQLFVDLRLAADDLPPGARLTVGEALLEVTATPHTGCAKFVARFGAEAMRWTQTDEGVALNLRGINARVLRGGRVRVGDPVERLGERASGAPA